MKYLIQEQTGHKVTKIVKNAYELLLNSFHYMAVLP